MGKTTTLRSITGLTPPRQGQVVYKDRDITGLPAYRVAKLGMGFVPEDRRIFPDRACILEKGHVRFAGTMAELQDNEDVRRQYLAL